MNEAYQVALKAEEKVERRTQHKFRGKGPRSKGRTNNDKGSEREDGDTSKPSTRGSGASRVRGFGRGRRKYVIACYRCGVEGHKASESLDKPGPSKRSDDRTQITMDDEASIAGENVIVLPQEQGKNLMFRRVLLKPEQQLIEELEQRKRVFKTKCKMQNKCCNLIIYGGSIENLVSIVVKRKLNLKCEPHPNPYRVSWLKKGQ